MSRFLAKEAIFAIICFLCTTTVALFVASIAIQQSRATSVGSFLDQELLDSASLTDSAMDHRAVDWAALKAINPDVIGWIIVEGTAISCPLVKAPREDPDYYLAHDLYGEENRYGCPYLDAACENEFDSAHCVIYGHNMGWDDALFADLQRFTDSDFAQQHTVAYILTPTKTIVLSLYAVATINGNEPLNRVIFTSPDDFIDYRETLMAKASRIASDESAAQLQGETNRAQLFTLCTCTYFFNPSNERTLVFAFPLSETPC